MSRRGRAFSAGLTARLWVRDAGDRREYWTESPGRPPPVYGERWTALGERYLRAFDPTRSKLAAALVRGWSDPLPDPGEAWLYLGAASGSTASHVADLVGPGGTVVAVEKSPRPFVRLLRVADRWPNLLPVLADARDPEGYADLLAPVDGIYADIAQPDQVEIVLRNAEYFLDRARGKLLVALKTPSMGRERSPSAHLRAAEGTLSGWVVPSRSVPLEPFHRGHYLLGGSGPEVVSPKVRSEGGRTAPGGRPVGAHAGPRRPYGPRRGRRAR